MRVLIGLLNVLGWLSPLFEADGGGGSGGSGGDGGGSGGEGGKGGEKGDSGGEGGSQGGEKSFTQADIDNAVKDRLARERKKTDGILSKLQAQIDELSGKPPAGGGEGGAGEGQPDPAAQEALRKAQDLVAKANAQMISTSAQAEALKLGVDPKFVADAVKLADLSKIEVQEDGSMDTAAISKAIDDVLKRMPVLKGNAGGEGGGGFRIGGEGGKGQGNNNGWAKRTDQQQQGQTSGKLWNRFNH